MPIIYDVAPIAIEEGGVVMSVAMPPLTEPPQTVIRADKSTLARMPRRVQCVAWEYQPERYRAICIEFSLVAESTVSILDAQQKLMAQIVDYLRELVSEGCPDHLVNRGLSRREICALWLELKRVQLRSWWTERFSHGPSFGDRAYWHQPVVGCL